jgi:hypothetical protein
MSVEIERSDASSFDKARVTIRGISDDTAGAISQRGAVCRIWAGYDGQDWLIFDGDIDERTIEDVLDNPGRSISFDAAEGRRELRWYRIDKIIAAAGETPQTALSRVAQLVGLNIGTLPPGLSNAPYSRPFVWSGPARGALEQIAADMGAMKPIVQLRTLILAKAGTPSNVSTIPLLRAGSLEKGPGSIVGSPTLAKRSAECTALWQPGILPRRKVRIESRKVNGDYIVKSTEERLESDADGDFFVTIKSSVMA